MQLHINVQVGRCFKIYIGDLVVPIRKLKLLSHFRLYTIHGVLQARTLEWVAFLFSRGSSQPRDRTQVSCIAGGFFINCTTKGNPRILEWVAYLFFSSSSLPMNQTRVSCIVGRFFANWAIREAPLEVPMRLIGKIMQAMLFTES